MRLAVVAFALLATPIAAATAAVPNMTCRAEREVASPQGRPQQATDIFRVSDGRLFHRWGDRSEYFYNHIVEVDFRRYASGHMVFVMAYDTSRGYVVIAAPTDWRVVYIDCKPA
ncbi:hypothetical protein [Bosea sp. PAMC 26642]|uniref:hypothetical protein n=1 Tax=Bosea sp. (strain PAMC 26642) TaxID=1792307 RepID=UPI000770570D|nr:hypothetical protein [Bosea sp. PAMC 26642]AMJ61988.1 hypothetical protein AXW83_18280 [Bosea sp. PAMC 26642]